MKKLTNDHRTRVTRMLIRKAFTTLLCKKPIQSISVKELCELAGINRGTFYAHYSDVYDLRSQIEAEMQEHLEQALLPILKDVGGEVTPVRVTTEIFQCLKDNSDLCIVTLGDHGDKDFMAKLLSIGRDFCLESYSKYFEGASAKNRVFLRICEFRLSRPAAKMAGGRHGCPPGGARRHDGGPDAGGGWSPAGRQPHPPESRGKKRERYPCTKMNRTITGRI